VDWKNPGRAAKIWQVISGRASKPFELARAKSVVAAPVKAQDKNGRLAPMHVSQTECWFGNLQQMFHVRPSGG